MISLVLNAHATLFARARAVDNKLRLAFQKRSLLRWWRNWTKLVKHNYIGSDNNGIRTVTFGYRLLLVFGTLSHKAIACQP